MADRKTPPGIEVVHGRLDRHRAEEIVDFWWRHRALSGEQAGRRLPDVVCLLRRDGSVAGASTVYAADVPLVGGRRFWIYECLLEQRLREQTSAMVLATFDALQREFDRAPGSPLGLCVVIGDPAEQRRRPQAQWPDPPAVHAGYLRDGRQVRVAYFEGAQVARELWSMGRDRPGAVLDRDPEPRSSRTERHRIELFADQDTVTAADVVRLWTSERVLAPNEAERRAAEILLVATDEQRRPVATSTAYAGYSHRLAAELWYMRVFVARAHRRAEIALGLALTGRDHLEQRFLSGGDRRRIGVMFVVENEGLKRHLPQATWPRTKFHFIGEDERGAHVRVYYFAGALLPEPAQGRA